MRRIFAGLVLTGLACVAGGCAHDSYAQADMEQAIARYEANLAPAGEPLAAAGRRNERGAEVRTDADGGGIKLLMAAAEGDGPGQPTEATVPDAGERPMPRYVHWKERRGPAYPDDFWRSVGRDLQELPATMWDDTKATVSNNTSLVLLALAGAGAALSGDWGNDCVEEHYDYPNGSQLNTTWDSVGGFFGSPAFHFPLAGAMYATSLARNDVKNYEISKTLINALALNGMTTMALKVAARTESPNGDEFGWPSGHTSSSFCFAAVMHESYGPWVGIPLYGFATFVAYERVDARNHDLSDVVSGAFLGIAIGHAVARNHQPRILGMDVVPYADPRGGTGLALLKRW
ncbi:MAG: phosphatase PAP2 family protein [Phycisphaerae bacterium]